MQPPSTKDATMTDSVDSELAKAEAARAAAAAAVKAEQCLGMTWWSFPDFRVPYTPED